MNVLDVGVVHKRQAPPPNENSLQCSGGYVTVPLASANCLVNYLIL